MRLPSRWRFILPAVAFLFGWGAASFILGKPVIVAGTSMYPTLKDGDCMLQISRLPWSAIARGDVVVVKDGQGQAVKRVIGLPGESIRLSGGSVLVNDFLLQEPYLAPSTRTEASTKGSEFALSEGHYLVLGDNRLDSFDSRDYGPVPISRIIGAIDVDHHQPVRYRFRPAISVRAQGHSVAFKE